jgi:hypothetical protein
MVKVFSICICMLKLHHDLTKRKEEPWIMRYRVMSTLQAVWAAARTPHSEGKSFLKPFTL